MIMPILAVRSVAESVKFYTEKISFRHMMSMPGVDGKPIYAVVTLGGTANLALNLQADVKARGAGVVLTIYIPDELDIDEYYDTCIANGALISKEIDDEYWGDRTFTVTDPDGFVLQISKSLTDASEDDPEAAIAEY